MNAPPYDPKRWSNFPTWIAWRLLAETQDAQQLAGAYAADPSKVRLAELAGHLTLELQRHPELPAIALNHFLSQIDCWELARNLTEELKSCRNQTDDDEETC